jgi:hypothetical protein
MIGWIETIHMKQSLQRHLKLDYFLMDYRPKAHRFYLIDFGLSKKMSSEEQHTHRLLRQ